SCVQPTHARIECPRVPVYGVARDCETRIVPTGPTNARAAQAIGPPPHAFTRETHALAPRLRTVMRHATQALVERTGGRHPWSRRRQQGWRSRLRHLRTRVHAGDRVSMTRLHA